MAADIAGLLSFGFASLAFAALAALVLSRRDAGLTSRLFLLVTVVQALWALVLAASVETLMIRPVALALTEGTRVLVWAAFLVSTRHRHGARSKVLDPSVLIAAGLSIASMFSAYLSWPFQLDMAIHLVSATLVLLILEQIYRSGDTAQRWALKFLAIALACAFGFDLLMYSEAMLFERLNQAWWTSRGFANALIVPLLAIAAARNRAWRIDISVSRQIVFHSTTLTIIGAYLLTISAAAYYVRYFGGSWGEIAQAVLLFGATIGLLTVGLSGSVRASIRVFVSKHFFSYQYDYREEWLRLTRQLSGSDGASSNALARRGIEGLAALVESTGGALWMRDGDRLEMAGHIGHEYEPKTLSSETAMLQWLAKQQWVIDLREWRMSPGSYPGLAVDPVLNTPRGWLIIPMIINDELAGIAVLDEPKTRIEIDWEVRDMLKAAGAQVASFLGVQRAAEHMAQSARFESFNRMSAFIVHDLKNLVSQLSLLLGNARKHRADPEFIDDMLATIESAVTRMQSMLGQLRNARSSPQSGDVTEIHLDALLERALQAKQELKPSPRWGSCSRDPALSVFADAQRLERIVGHLLQNAVEACQDLPEARVELSFLANGSWAEVEVLDTGRGMSDEFVEQRLFRPFETTKEQGMGIGLFECRDYARALGGELRVHTRQNEGTRITLSLPLPEVSTGQANG